MAIKRFISTSGMMNENKANTKNLTIAASSKLPSSPNDKT